MSNWRCHVSIRFLYIQHLFASSCAFILSVHLAEGGLLTQDLLDAFSARSVDAWMQVESVYPFLTSVGVPMLVDAYVASGDIRSPNRTLECLRGEYAGLFCFNKKINPPIFPFRSKCHILRIFHGRILRAVSSADGVGSASRNGG